MKPATTAEILITVIARLLRGSRHVVAGAQSPVPGAAALLAKSLGWGVERVTVLGSSRYNAYTDGGVETFDMAAQGRRGAGRRIDNVIHADTQMSGGRKAIRGADHVLGRQQADQMRRGMGLEGLGKARQGGDQQAGHGRLLAAIEHKGG